MAGNSTYLQDAILNWIKGTTFPAAPASVFVALFNGDPTDTGAGGTDVTTTLRAAGRVAATFGTISTAAGASSMANSALVDFGNADAGATVTHFGIFDAATAGNLIGSGAVDNPRTFVATNPVNFPIGDLTVSQS